MTTTPNDAAVNAESAAKLVMAHCNDLCDVGLDNESKLSANDLAKLSKAAAFLERTVLPVIERHATPQTQATHGEGEAVGYVDRTGLEMLRAGTLETLLMHGRKRRVDYAPLYTQPAPSPTAAPALTEEELLDLRALSELPMLARSMRMVCAKAADALSGVAAQGDGT